MKLHELKDTTRKKQKVQRVGRGVGSKRGKTCCRGVKGDGSRSGYKRRYGYEGGGVPLYMRLPTRGFSRKRFQVDSLALNLSQIDRYYREGETVNIRTLREKKLMTRTMRYFKVLASGSLTKSLVIEANGFSKQAQEKLEKQNISFKTL
jgi:large subunit ribosomal protein L15